MQRRLGDKHRQTNKRLRHWVLLDALRNPHKKRSKTHVGLLTPQNCPKENKRQQPGETFRAAPPSLPPTQTDRHNKHNTPQLLCCAGTKVHAHVWLTTVVAETPHTQAHPPLPHRTHREREVSTHRNTQDNNYQHQASAQAPKRHELFSHLLCTALHPLCPHPLPPNAPCNGT